MMGTLGADVTCLNPGGGGILCCDDSVQGMLRCWFCGVGVNELSGCDINLFL